MKCVLVVALVGGLALGLAGWTFAAETPSPTAAATTSSATSTPSTTATRTVGDLKSELAPDVYERIVTPINAKVAEARTAIELIKKENEKPADKRNPAAIISLMERESSFYIAAALAARQGAAQVNLPEQKAAIIEQFEKPNRQRAVGILSEIASIAAQQRDFNRAAALYKRILAVDPEDQAAKDALKVVLEEAKNAPKTPLVPTPYGTK
jgi:hypothetical protein